MAPPLLLEALQPELFSNVTFDLTTCSAGRLDQELERFFRQPDVQKYSDIYIMDMTPDSDYSFQQLEQHFANHWLIFDHHESEEELRQKYAANCISPANPAQLIQCCESCMGLGSANRSTLPTFRLRANRNCKKIVELIRAYDTWDWQNDPNMSNEERKAADELNQLFWFYPLSQSQSFVTKVYQTGWKQYHDQNTLLINTLNAAGNATLTSISKTLLSFPLTGIHSALFMPVISNLKLPTPCFNGTMSKRHW